MDIQKLREEIDIVDLELLQLINKRAELASLIGKAKQQSAAVVYVPEREQEILRRLSSLNQGPLTNAHITAIFRQIISAARNLEQPLRVAFWGPSGSFSHMAATHQFGEFCEPHPVGSIREVFDEVERERADYGIVPVENSTAGAIPDTLDEMGRSRLLVVAENYEQIHHNLLYNGDISEIRTLYTGVQPLHQCQDWLRQNLPHVDVKEVTTTSRAAELASKEAFAAAIGNPLASSIYNLDIAVANIEDNPRNFTRFLVVGRNEPRPTGKDKTSLLFSVENKPGQLIRAMSVFQAHNINMSMIESRPSKKRPGEYLFYVDVDGHRQDPNIALALDELHSVCSILSIIGSYAASEQEF